MEAIERNLREEAKRLLAEKKVDVIVGYEAGTLPLTATPTFITDPAEAERLVWNPLCVHNLAKYVHDVITQHRNSQKRVKPESRTRKVVGVVARGCTSRSIILHLQERQYGREDIVIIGVPCQGYIDRKKLSVSLNGEEVLSGTIEGDEIKVMTGTGEKRLRLSDVLADNCITCRFNNPIISDVSLGEPASAMKAEEEFNEVNAFEQLSSDERWAYFEKEMAKCIRCYACRQACPSCYCPECFVEQSRPQWVGIGGDASDTQVFQIMRIFHMVGRCVDCGSCIAVCPMGVDLRKFLKKLDKDAFELFGSRAGSSLEDPPVLSTFKEHECEDFIYNP
ncbi:MAG: 4Fe-4S dicluster domain-containing protein [Syntrophales bacterium]|nr:4Fe-4S dicluster domain-containing protein [Syntrophales bacterium]